MENSSKGVKHQKLGPSHSSFCICITARSDLVLCSGSVSSTPASSGANESCCGTESGPWNRAAAVPHVPPRTGAEAEGNSSANRSSWKHGSRDILNAQKGPWGRGCAGSTGTRHSAAPGLSSCYLQACLVGDGTRDGVCQRACMLTQAPAQALLSQRGTAAHKSSCAHSSLPLGTLCRT